MAYFLGVDVGATRTRALVADERGRAIGLGEAGPGNHEEVGYEGLTAALQTSVKQALDKSGIAIGQIAGAGFGVAGYDWASERQPTLNAIATLGIQAPVQAVNDSVIGLIAGAEAGWGVVIIAGTGCNSYGRDRYGHIGRVTGEGDMMGEFGGAYDVVAEAVHHVARAWGRRGPDTALTELFLQKTGAASVEELLEGLCEQKYPVDPQLAPLVFNIADQGDVVAQQIVEWTARQLADLAIGVIRQLHFQKQVFETVLAGSMFRSGAQLIDPLKACLRTVAPAIQCVQLSTSPVVGAVLLGMEQVGIRNPAIRWQLITSTQPLIKTVGERGSRQAAD